MVQILPAKFDLAVAREVSDYSRKLASTSGRAEAVYDRDVGKAGRDGQLLASIAAARTSLREAGSDRTVILLSSAARLRRADKKFRATLGAPEAIISSRAIAYMAALVPEIGLGAGSLRQALFDFGARAHLTDIQRIALRVIRGSTQYDIPWAKRRRLQDELESVLRQEADKRDVSTQAMTNKFVAGDKSAHPEEVIAAALGQMALHSKAEDELREAQGEIRKLRSELNEARDALLIAAKRGETRRA
jgi:hypothetical protein